MTPADVAVRPPLPAVDEDARRPGLSTPTSDRLAHVAVRCAQGLVIVGALVVAIVALNAVRLIVVPLVLAVFLTTLLHPPVRLLRRHGLSATAATTVVVLGAVLSVGALLLFLVPRTVNAVDALSGSVASAIADLEDLLQRRVGIDPTQVARFLGEARDQFTGGGLGSAVTGVVTAGEVLTQLVLTLVLAVYLVHSGAELFRSAVSLAPERHRDAVLRAGDTTWSVLGGYIRGTAFIGLVDALLIGAGLWILDVSLAIPLTVLIFLGAFVPLVGAFVSGLLAAVVALVDRGPTIALTVVAITLLVQQIEGHLLSPRVMGHVLKLHPVVVICAVTAGGAAAGILGAFLAVPVLGVVAGIVRDQRAGPAIEHAVEGQDTADDAASTPSPPP